LPSIVHGRTLSPPPAWTDDALRPATDILVNEIQTCLLDLVHLSFLVPLNAAQMAHFMRETFEPDAVPCGHLGFDEVCGGVKGRLCAWFGQCQLTRFRGCGPQG
jgi:hypothetical protein